MTELLPFLAQAATSQPKGAAPQPSPFSMLWPLFFIFIIFYFILIRPQSAEKKKRQAMINAIKKNDRVVTIGGILGTVQYVKDDEITLKVDESSNTKITFTRSAIQRVLSAGPADPAPPQTPGTKK
jgi:preprotein translocase subunit YajC